MDENQTKQHEKLSTMGELAAVLAHEIKNPMNSIIINLEVLRPTLGAISEEDKKEKAQKYLGVIEGEIKRLEKVITSFLDLATPAPSESSRVRLNEIVEQVLDLLRLELEKNGISNNLDLDSTLPIFFGSCDQIKQALLNLILNAVQAMPDGGELKIQTSHNDKTVRVVVSDTGSGIEEHILSKIFSPYFTTKKKGSGLGLAIVRRILREHGGYVDVSSELGKGTSFELVFPKSSSN